MRTAYAALSLLYAASLGVVAAQAAERPADGKFAQASPNISSTGRMMPPTSGREPPTPLRPSTEVEMLKAQKAAEDRNKAWDTKMRRTMGTICNGC